MSDTAITDRSQAGAERKNVNVQPAVQSRNGTISASEFKFLICFVIALVALTTLPYVVGYLHRVPGKVFSGVLDHSFDTNNYLAYIHESSSGRWLFYNPMTGEPHRPVFFNLEWLLIGKVGFLLNLSPAAAMDVCRVLSLVLLCFAVYWLSAFLFDDRFMRRIALVACLAGGGFGWVAAVHLLHIRLDSSYFLDLTNANLFPFYWTLRLPHFLIAETFVVFGLCFFLRGELRGRVADYLAAGACYMAAGSCRPYDMLFLMAATGLFLILAYFRAESPRSPIVVRALPILIALPLLGYYYWIFKLHPIFRWWSLPGLPAPAAWLLAIGFGPSFLLLLIAIWRLRRDGISYPGLFLLSSFLTAVALAHMHWLFHFSFQFATNILIPMVMLALLGLEKPVMSMRSSVRWRTAVPVVLFLNSLTSFAMAGQAVTLTARGEYDDDARLRAAFSWIDQHTKSGSTVLANYDIANTMPQYTQERVFCGYGNAVKAETKFKALRQFLNPHASDEFRENLLRENKIDLVLLTNSEADDLPSFVRAPFVHELFRNDAAAILSPR